MDAEKFDPFIAEWISFSKNPNYNLIEKCLKMAQILEYPELNISKYIDTLIQDLLGVGNAARPDVILEADLADEGADLAVKCQSKAPRRILTI